MASLVACATAARCISQLPTSISSVTQAPPHFVTRLDSIRRAAVSLESSFTSTSALASQRWSSSSARERSQEPLALHFQDCHMRLQHWWEEHLKDKAAMVHAAGFELLAEEESEDTFVICRPLLVDWEKDVYPPVPCKDDHA